jgi:hypothetical protein
MDLTSIDFNSDFALSIKKLFTHIKPLKLIETGTYIGTGSTAIIASFLKNTYANSAKFLSIEINPSHCTQAKDNLKELGLFNFVTIMNGLSIRWDQVPTKKQIEEKFIKKVWPEDVYIDHDKNQRIDKYFSETNFTNLPDQQLLQGLRAFDFRPDFVLLDSGGHIGFIEFQTLLAYLTGPCYVVLDDIYHVKHWEGLNYIFNDKRFLIHTLSKEKFGFCIALFSKGR